MKWIDHCNIFSSDGEIAGGESKILKITIKTCRMVLKRSQSMQLVNSPCPESLGTIRQLSTMFWSQNIGFSLSATCEWAKLGREMSGGRVQNLQKIQYKLVGWCWKPRNRCNSWVVHVLKVWGLSDNFERSNCTEKWFFDFPARQNRLFGTIGVFVKWPTFRHCQSKSRCRR